MRLFKKLLSRIKWAIRPVQTIGKNNNVYIDCKRCGHVEVRINGNNNTVKIEKDVLLYNLRIAITGNNNKVVISRRSRIYNLKLNISGNDSKFIFGENAGVREADVIIWENQSVVIGKDAMLSYGINIRTSDSHSIYDEETGERINTAKSVHVGEHTWLAQNVTLLKGADIGAHSIVGFGSICSKSYPDHCIVVGIPGKVIKRNVKWSRKLK